MNIKELHFQKKSLNQVFHATLNPDGPGAVRIHMLPPKFSYSAKHPGILILNGQKILPITPSWAILFSHFLTELNSYEEREIGKDELAHITENVLRNVKPIFSRIKYIEMKQDLPILIETLCDIAYGKTPKIEISSFHLQDYAPYMKAPFCMDLRFQSDGGLYPQIIERCKEIGIPQLTFLCKEGMEPSEILPCIDHARWFYTRLNADHHALTPTDCVELLQAGLDSIQLTLFSCEESIHNQLADSDNFALLKNNIKSAVTAGINLIVHTPLCTKNTDYLHTLIFLHALGVDYVTCSLLPSSESAFMDRSLQLTQNQLFQILDTATDYGYANRMEIDFTTFGVLSEQELASLGLRTPPYDMCLTHMTVTAEGSVYAGEGDLTRMNPLGNLLTDSWKSIWYGTACTELRKQLNSDSLRKE